MSCRILLMGVSGSGKSTLGARLAEALAIPFADADASSAATKLRSAVAGTDAPH